MRKEKHDSKKNIICLIFGGFYKQQKEKKETMKNDLPLSF